MSAGRRPLSPKHEPDALLDAKGAIEVGLVHNFPKAIKGRAGCLMCARDDLVCRPEHEGKGGVVAPFYRALHLGRRDHGPEGCHSALVREILRRREVGPEEVLHLPEGPQNDSIVRHGRRTLTTYATSEPFALADGMCRVHECPEPTAMTSERTVNRQG
jgi:hypothetical protein